MSQFALRLHRLSPFVCSPSLITFNHFINNWDTLICVLKIHGQQEKKKRIAGRIKNIYVYYKIRDQSSHLLSKVWSWWSILKHKTGFLNCSISLATCSASPQVKFALVHPLFLQSCVAAHFWMATFPHAEEENLHFCYSKLEVWKFCSRHCPFSPVVFYISDLLHSAARLSWKSKVCHWILSGRSGDDFCWLWCTSDSWMMLTFSKSWQLAIKFGTDSWSSPT